MLSVLKKKTLFSSLISIYICFKERHIDVIHDNALFKVEALQYFSLKNVINKLRDRVRSLAKFMAMQISFSTPYFKMCLRIKWEWTCQQVVVSCEEARQ